MYSIGISGGIATGKSTVVDMLKKCGAVIIDCDLLAREVVQPGSEGLTAVCHAFGEKSCQADGTLNRRYIGDIVFQSPERKKELEAIIHPLIVQRIKALMRQYEAESGVQVVFLDMPLLFELKYFLYVDEAWLIYVDPQTQLRRLMDRNHYTEKEALARIHAQLPIDEKRALAQIIIDNSDTLEKTEQQVRIQWNRLVDKLHL